jgi:hypothetical protein
MPATSSVNAAFGYPTNVVDAPSSTAPVNENTISDLFSAIDTAVTQDAQSQAETFTEAGDTGEENAYNTAAAISNANARLAVVNGSIQQAQEALALRQTQGAAVAATASSGFTTGGSALDILRGNNRQGLLEQQLTGSTAELASGGYAQQAAASTAESSAAGAAAGAAGVLSASDLAVAAQSKTNAINEAAAMGLTIPGLTSLSDTNIPDVNPVTIATTAAQAQLNPNTGIDPPPAGSALANQVQTDQAAAAAVQAADNGQPNTSTGGIPTPAAASTANPLLAASEANPRPTIPGTQLPSVPSPTTPNTAAGPALQAGYLNGI